MAPGETPALLTSTSTPPARLNTDLVTNAADPMYFWFSNTNAAQGSQYVNFAMDSLTDPTVPEPISMLLLGSGLCGLVLWRRYRCN